MEQQIHFCTTHDDVRIAYATVGEGPPLVKAANWLNHLEFDWRSPIWRHWLQEFSRDHLLLRYDERGNGLSDWNVDNLTFEAFVQDLEAVVEAVGLDRFPILGISQGGPVAIAYTARHPEKVSHLILYGSYARGFAKRQPSAEEIERRQAELTLVKLGWGQDNPAFRQLWTTLFLPDATPEEWKSFNDLHRVSTSPENAVRFLNEFANIDVVDLLPQVNVPTLVMHCRDESTVPFEEGRLLAAMIPGARFVQLEGKNHLLLEGEPAWTTFVNEVRSFLGSAPRTTGEAQTRGAGRVDPLSQADLPNRYSILSSLGAGGMGEVYLAEDTRLGRKIALKTLPSEFTHDKERLRRFQQEARAASALNHPNILTIHEIGVESGAHFIATEFVDGETLRAKLNRGRIKLDEALEVAQQTAFALTAAHGAGIVHRDIKPENIMVRHDGIVKVLDFGLAKLLEGGSREAIDPEADTRALVQTEPGKVMGTPAYMSPEQARGLELDARTDIWSLGVVLYEMLAGRAPFRGETNSHTVVSILESEPPPLATFAPDTAAELQRIVRKALTKDRDSRYQTARDLMIDLKNLRRELDIKSEMQTSTSSRVDFHLTNQQKPDSAAATSLGEQQSASDGAPRDGSIGYRIGAFFVMLLLAAGSLSIWYYRHRQQAGVAIDSVVVLPFINTSNDPNAEYLSDGIAESLMNNLSQLPNLKVISRNAAFQYKGKDQNAQKVGKDLSVRAVVTGTVKQLGDQIVISVSLDDALDNHQIWGEQYNRKLSDALAVQQQISRDITDKLRLQLSGEQQKQLTAHDPTNPEAYQDYLKGRYYWNKREKEYLDKAINQFQLAASKDPKYALAYVGLADSHTFLEEYGYVDPAETYLKAKFFAQRALEIDPSLGEAHASLGIAYSHNWEWDKSESEFKQALALNPRYGSAHHWYNLLLWAEGRFDESRAESQKAYDLDPLSLTIGSSLAKILLVKGETDLAIAQSRKLVELDPKSGQAANHLGLGLLKKGQTAEGLAALERAVQLSKLSRWMASLGYCYAISGKGVEALATAKELEARYAKREALGQDVASVYAGLGQKDLAFAWLEKDFQAHSGLLSRLRWDIQFEPLRSDPRYVDLLHRMGLNL
jgi:serine/threonine protein kinase/pimeloyl-ACP methyl ester carboxylesterase/Tfp pilus assembly protein PilF